MGAFASAFEKLGVKATEFEEFDESKQKEIDADLEIDFLETWLKMLERNASLKERYNFVVKHGFLSEKHFNLYLQVKDDADNLAQEIEDMEKFESENSHKIQAKKNKLVEMNREAENIKEIVYYKMIMRALHQSDYSPYGENLLKSKLHLY